MRRWASDNGEALAETYKTAATALPEALNDRQQDMWEILFAIADRAGGDWPKEAREAALALCGRSGSEPNLAELLLADCHRYREENSAVKVLSRELVEWLNRQEERPWKDLRHGNGIDQRSLRSMLAGFGLYSKTLRIGTGVGRGYDFGDFEQAFRAYIHQAEATAANAAGDEEEQQAEASCAPYKEPGERYPDAQPELMQTVDDRA